MELTSENVTSVFMDCIAKDRDFEVNPDPYVVIQGITSSFALVRERVAAHESDIEGLLTGLSDDFREGGGGGMSFLAMCDDRNGNQWTGMHKVMQELVVLGIAAEKVVIPFPREVWSALPGGMPYIVVK